MVDTLPSQSDCYERGYATMAGKNPPPKEKKKPKKDKKSGKTQG
jgi:hypothetical protein